MISILLLWRILPLLYCSSTYSFTKYLYGAVSFVIFQIYLLYSKYICYWLRAGRSGDRIPVGARFSAHVQTCPGAHPANCTMGTGSFTVVKRPGRDTDYPPLLSPKVRMSRAIPLLPIWTLGGLL
jgi:hypothetical protein